MLFTDSFIIIDVNGNLTSPIPLGRSIRQGCPIAPSLFVIVVDALFYLLRAPSLDSLVKGLLLPNNDTLLNSLFADDTTLFLELEEINFCDTLDRLEFFCLASGAKIAPKSLVLGWSESPPNWVQLMSWQWKGLNEIISYLGIPFFVNLSTKAM